MAHFCMHPCTWKNSFSNLLGRLQYHQRDGSAREDHEEVPTLLPHFRFVPNFQRKLFFFTETVTLSFEQLSEYNVNDIYNVRPRTNRVNTLYMNTNGVYKGKTISTELKHVKKPK